MFEGAAAERERAMITVENDWVEYATVPVRMVAVRGGSACAQRTRVVTDRPRAAAAPPRSGPTRAVDPRVQPAPLAGRAPEPRLRLTRRGRVVLVVLPAVLAATSALVSLTAPFAEAQPTRPPTTTVVRTGDTLWSIAERIAPQADPRDVVADLEGSNHLPGAGLQAGTRLTLPAHLTH
jgi:Tfp pilus assembly protein FimV